MSETPEISSRETLAWRVMTVLLGVEALCGVVLVIYVAQEILADSVGDLGLRISVLLAVVLAVVWLIVTLVGAIKTRSNWVRGSALTIHVLMFAAGTGVLQLIADATLVGWVLVLLSFAGFAAALIAQPIRDNQ